jgi:hypothetical protein
VSLPSQPGSPDTRLSGGALSFRHQLRLWASALTLGVLIACVGYELAVALGWISLGTVPGQGPPASGWVLLVALLAMIAGAALALSRDLAAIALPLAAAAFVVARFYSFDDYYLPSLRRFSDGGTPSPPWIYALAAAAGAIAASAAVVRVAAPNHLNARDVTRGLSALILILCAYTAFIQGIGH